MAATPITIQPAVAVLPVGTTTFGSVTLDATYSKVVMTLPRSATWADSAGVEIIEYLVDVSFDGGTTWQQWCGFGTCGGTVTSKLMVAGAHQMTHPIPAPCHVRGRLINKTGAALSALSVATAVFS